MRPFTIMFLAAAAVALFGLCETSKADCPVGQSNIIVAQAGFSVVRQQALFVPVNQRVTVVNRVPQRVVVNNVAPRRVVVQQNHTVVRIRR